MKQVSLGLLLFAFMFMAALQPAQVFADNDYDDDDRSEYRYDDDEDEDEDEDENDDDEDEDSRGDDELEIEADIFTDITIVKVELPNGTKTTFSTDADTEAEVVDVIADKFDLTESEILAALELEIEDRASRTGERVKIKDRVKDRIKVCHTDSSDELEVEADVFTDITIVKVELATGTKKVFETTATTSAAIVALVADRFDLDADDVEAALDFEIEDRASRAADRAIAYNPADCDDDNANVGNNNGTSTLRDAELRNKIAELERLLETLIRLFTARFGN
jgi:uncharacterized protein (DUF433 family)